MILAVAAPAAVGAPVILQNATATATQSGFSISQTIDGNLGGPGVVNGWAIHDLIGDITDETAVYETQTDVGGPGGAALTFTLTQNFGSSITVGRFRLSITGDDRANFADGLNDVTANWIALAPATALATGGATLTIQTDASILASGASPAITVYTVAAWTDMTRITGIRIEMLEDASLPASGPGRASNGNLVLQEFAVDAINFPDPPNADFDGNGTVDGDDLTRWRTNFGSGATHMEGNANDYQDADVDGADFLLWQRQLGGPPPVTGAASVPEPGALAMALLFGGGLAFISRRRYDSTPR
ncbi:MAG: hypothetical protein H0T51_00135 [Pirellulales bacterium]|nr:hypothetical protein [Pirellulales bacterium]